MTLRNRHTPITSGPSGVAFRNPSYRETPPARWEAGARGRPPVAPRREDPDPPQPPAETEGIAERHLARGNRPVGALAGVDHAVEHVVEDHPRQVEPRAGEQQQA